MTCSTVAPGASTIASSNFYPETSENSCHLSTEIPSDETASEFTRFSDRPPGNYYFESTSGGDLTSMSVSMTDHGFQGELSSNQSQEAISERGGGAPIKSKANNKQHTLACQDRLNDEATVNNKEADRRRRRDSEFGDDDLGDDVRTEISATEKDLNCDEDFQDFGEVSEGTADESLPVAVVNKNETFIVHRGDAEALGESDEKAHGVPVNFAVAFEQANSTKEANFAAASFELPNSSKRNSMDDLEDDENDDSFTGFEPPEDDFGGFEAEGEVDDIDIPGFDEESKVEDDHLNGAAGSAEAVKDDFAAFPEAKDKEDFSAFGSTKTQATAAADDDHFADFGRSIAIASDDDDFAAFGEAKSDGDEDDFGDFGENGDNFGGGGGSGFGASFNAFSNNAPNKSNDGVGGPR